MKLMKTKITVFVPVICVFMSTFSMAQNQDPRRSSRTAAQYDAACVDTNMADTHDMIYFSQIGAERGSTSETIELAQDLVTNLSEIYYSMEQLAVAGAGSTSGGRSAGGGSGSLREANDFNDKLSSTHGFSFDTLWLGGLLRMHQEKLAAFAVQNENATNERLKAALKEAMSVLRKQIPRINSLQKQLIRKDMLEKKEAAREEAAKKKKR